MNRIGPARLSVAISEAAAARPRKPIALATAANVSRSFPLTAPSSSSWGARLRRWQQALISWLNARVGQHASATRQLEMLGVQQLGDKRFLALVRVEDQKFLIGGSASSVALLASIPSSSASGEEAR